MGESKVDGATLFSVVASDRTKGNGHTLKIHFNKKNSTRTNKPPKNTKTKKAGKKPKNTHPNTTIRNNLSYCKDD